MCYYRHYQLYCHSIQTSFPEACESKIQSELFRRILANSFPTEYHGNCLLMSSLTQTFPSIDFFLKSFFYCDQIMSYWGSPTSLHKACGKLVWFWKTDTRKSARSPGCLAQNIKDESTETNYLRSLTIPNDANLFTRGI